ncbi:MAG: hypothetical protein VB144_11965 [Clostridia bacterium]|nr:hypothetical protein [Clostridia bacterium]
MAKRTWALVLLSLMTALLSGCTLQTPIDGAQERVQVMAALNSWVRGVEAYEMDAMAGDGVMAAGFRLTIKEGMSTETKDLARLRSEISIDIDEQALLRMTKGYVIRLDIDGSAAAMDVPGVMDSINGWAVATIVGSTAEATGSFEVYEKTTSIPEWRSDSGFISVGMVKTTAGWKMESMTIKFGRCEYRARASSAGMAGMSAGGFGFGTYTGW